MFVKFTYRTDFFQGFLVIDALVIFLFSYYLHYQQFWNNDDKNIKLIKQIMHSTTLTKTLVLEAMPWMNQLKWKSKINVHFWLATRKCKKSKNNILSVGLLIIPMNGCSPLTWNTPATEKFLTVNLKKTCTLRTLKTTTNQP